MSDSTIQTFVTEQRELLALELQAETDEHDVVDSDERASHVLGDLEASDVSVGLYGRTVVQLSLWSERTSSKGEPILPAHRFTVGDEVEIRSKQHHSKARFQGGVISAVSDSFVSVALFRSPTKGKSETTTDDQQDDDDGVGSAPLALVPRSSADVHRKLLQGLEKLERHGIDHPIAGRVVRGMFHPESSNVPPSVKHTPLQTFNNMLDESQKSSIDFALQSDRPFALIHGPPGTGKTTTVAELIHQAVRNHGMKVLVTAPSNVAVDNILERLMKVSSETSKTKGNRNSSKSKGLKAIRLGHPARIKSSILSYSLEALVQSSEGTEIVADVRSELQSFLRVISSPKSRPSDKRIAYREIKALRKEVRTREEKVVQELITTAQVVLATTVGAANRILDKVEGGFDLVVIDEAAQALEASCWIPILRGKKVVLAGDHCQLPPTIKSRHSRAIQGLGRTMFERLMYLYGDNDHNSKTAPRISRMLNVQYRMHEDIANWASEVMYHGELKTHESVKHRTLAQLEGIHKVEDEMDADLEAPLLLIDTAGCDMYETVNPSGSRFNEGEATIVAQHVRKLVNLGLKPEDICIITPYNGQVDLLRKIILPEYPKLEIRSVDGFQGGERDAVILSLVRSSDKGGKAGIGFLRDNRRQNVAVTRAKRHLAVVCDSETVSQSKFIGTLIAWIEKHGKHHSAMEYFDPGAPDEVDLRAAEEEILRLVESSTTEPVRHQARSTPKQNMATAQQQPSGMKLEAQKRTALMDKIVAFVEQANPGDEMPLNTELSNYDRRLVHEFAEQNGLGHRSEGTQGKDRRIILRVAKKILKPVPPATTVNEGGSPQENQTDEPTQATSGFSAFVLDDSDDSSSDNEDSNKDDTTDSNKDEDKTPNASTGDGESPNSLLAQLAKERLARQKGRETSQPVPSVATKLKKKKKGTGQKLRGAKNPEPKEEDDVVDLDDMSFLDTQIEKAQNAHGRKVTAAGKGYRTIVNGILNASPEPRLPGKDTRASTALHSKLQEAQNSRKSKGGKKKKR